MGLRTILKRILGYQKLEHKFLNEYYSQQGEDCILDNIFWNKETGFFVDVGALHPYRYSNTYKFYKKGWRGINIDALPGSMTIFKKLRPRDINLEIPISSEKKVMPFFVFTDNALNTLSSELAKKREVEKFGEIERIINIETDTLASVLDKYLPSNTKIDFLTVDAEGFDFEILQSNNWQKYRPDIILLESELNILNFSGSDMYHFMRDNRYTIDSKIGVTYLLRNDDVMEQKNNQVP